VTMPDDHGASKRRRERDTALSRTVGKKADRKRQAREETHRTIWFGLGMFGLVGWAVALPTLVGVAVGIWIDRTYHPRFSWTLMLLVIGVLAGCVNAWFWLSKERGSIEQGRKGQGRG